MSVTINLYSQASENKKVDKFLGSPIVSLEGDIIEPSSMYTPIIVLPISNFSDANYAYIPIFHRYYYIEDKVWQEANLWRVYFHTDVLMSFKGGTSNNRIGIRDNSAIINKQQYNNINKYFNDGTFISESQTIDDQSIKFEPVFGSSKEVDQFGFLLTCYGGYDYGG